MEDLAVRRVLAAVDLTPLGRRVADRARMVAEPAQADLTLLHVLEPLEEAFISEAVSDLVRRQRREGAEKLAEWCRGRSSGEVALVIRKGAPPWEVATAGKHADLVVIGSSSSDPDRLGSTSRRVVEGTRVDVLVVRRQPRAPYRRVVAAVDLSPASAAAVDLALRLAPEGEVSVVLALPSRFEGSMVEAGMFPEEVEASRKQRREAARAAMDRFVARWPDRVRTVVEHGPPGRVVEEVVRRRGADLATVGSRGAGATRMVLLGTVAEDVLQSVPVDVGVAHVAATFRRP